MKQLFTWSLCLETTTLIENIGLGMLNEIGICVMEYCEEGNMTFRPDEKGNSTNTSLSSAYLSARTVHTYVEKPAHMKL